MISSKEHYFQQQDEKVEGYKYSMKVKIHNREKCIYIIINTEHPFSSEGWSIILLTQNTKYYYCNQGPKHSKCLLDENKTIFAPLSVENTNTGTSLLITSIPTGNCIVMSRGHETLLSVIHIHSYAHHHCNTLQCWSSKTLPCFFSQMHLGLVSSLHRGIAKQHLRWSSNKLMKPRRKGCQDNSQHPHC